jgi:methylated-DNA-[protein]-cysteine S-methyltransferase
MKLHLSHLPSPVGDLLLVTDGQDQVRALDFADHRVRLHRLLGEHYETFELVEAPAPAAIAAALARYFEGDLCALDGIPTATAGSDFQRQVWAALRAIPPGRTMSYRDLAISLGYEDPRAAIHVGAANGANPVSIIVPCHRVIGTDGNLKGYGGGAHRKRWLLKHEGALATRGTPLETPRLPGV